MPASEQFVDEPRVEVEALRVDRAAVGTTRAQSVENRYESQPESLHERDVVAVAVVVVAGDVAVVAVETAPGTRANASQIESVRPSSWAAPSIWEAAVADPNRKSAGSRAGQSRSCGRVSLVAMVIVVSTLHCSLHDSRTSCLPAMTKSTSSGMVASTAPVSTIE